MAKPKSRSKETTSTENSEQTTPIVAAAETPSPSSACTAGQVALIKPVGTSTPEKPLNGQTGTNETDDSLYFFEDEIFRIDKKGRIKFGLVIETAETYSGDEDDDYDDVLNKGEVRVAWYPEGKEDVLSEKTVSQMGLADRTLMPGDVVRRLMPKGHVSNAPAQCGYCREINMCADVQVLGTKNVIKHVVGERLRLISEWPRDCAVCLDSWVGSIKDVDEVVVLKTNSGARVEVPITDLYSFKDVNARVSRGIFTPQAFYAGDIVLGQLSSMDNVRVLTPNNTLPVNKKGKPLSSKFTIESINTTSVWVHWQYRALADGTSLQDAALQAPENCVTGDSLKRLKLLNLFEPCMLQINDRNYLTYTQHDRVMRKALWEKEQAAKFKTILKEKMTGSPTSPHSDHGVSVSKAEKTRHCTKAGTIGKSKKLSLEKLSNGSGSGSGHKDIKEKPAKHAKLSSNGVNDSEWLSADSDEDEVVTPEAANGITEKGSANSSTSSSASPRGSNKSSSHHFKRKTPRTLKSSVGALFDQIVTPEVMPKEGDRLATEALLVYSTATVVWQNGTVESDIPSTQLYPIHHLDNHEFFPGDFVTSNTEDLDVSFRDYGVIQTVDHVGRTARVKWFTTYTSLDEPRPTYKGETEVSVYDLKDHPDFQYHPGTIVIRVANFVGEDANCTAGQIIDNFPDGHVRVWWVDGHISMCWPQDVFEVGQYDHAEWTPGSEDSWETESENSEFGGSSSPKLSISESHILSNVERARVAIARLEEIFNISPNLQSPDVIRKLMTVYKGCRYLDRLLCTSFFHEDNFMGLVERVRIAGGTQTIAPISERTTVRKNRLISDTQLTSPSSRQQQLQVHTHAHPTIVAVNSPQKAQSTTGNSTGKEYAPKVLMKISSSSFKFTHGACSVGASSVTAVAGSSQTAASKRRNSSTTVLVRSEANAKDVCTTEVSTSETNATSTPKEECSAKIPDDGVKCILVDATSPKQNSYNAEKNELLKSAMLNIDKAYEKASQLKHSMPNSSPQNDSGTYSHSENCSTSSCDLSTGSQLAKTHDDQKSVSCSSIELTEDVSPEQMCVHLCSLLKTQLVKCIAEIREKYYKGESDSVDVNSENAETDTIIEVSKHGNKSEQDQLKMPIATVEADEDDDSGAYASSADASALAPPDCFQILSNVPKTHKFYSSMFQPHSTQQYYKAVQREHRMLKNSLPPGVWVRVFEDRLDLLSVMIEGPKKTPYEDGMFFFDLQLGRDYPKSPPVCHYVSYCSDRLNPNLYEDGKVCVSLLGTWAGRDSEVWGSNSTLLQVIVSIQGLILVPEPYFNEAGYDKQKGTLQGKDNSRMYNEMVVIKMVQATTKLLQQPPEIFRDEIVRHFKSNGCNMYERIRGWMELSKQMANADEEAKTSASTEKQDIASCSGADAISDTPPETKSNYSPPEFSLVPASRGFCLTLAGLLETFKLKVDALSAYQQSQLESQPQPQLQPVQQQSQTSNVARVDVPL